MSWHLKDRELEKQLIELDSNFLWNLNEAMYQFSLRENEEGEDLIDVDMEIYRPPRYITAQLQIEKTDIEKIVEYDPHAWNDYPEVTPPYDVMMRIKMKNGYLRAGYLKKFPDGDSWVNPNGVLMCNAENAEIELFRPWED